MTIASNLKTALDGSGVVSFTSVSIDGGETILPKCHDWDGTYCDDGTPVKGPVVNIADISGAYGEALDKNDAERFPVTAWVKSRADYEGSPRIIIVRICVQVDNRTIEGSSDTSTYPNTLSANIGGLGTLSVTRKSLASNYYFADISFSGVPATTKATMPASITDPADIAEWELHDNECNLTFVVSPIAPGIAPNGSEDSEYLSPTEMNASIAASSQTVNY